MFELSIVIPVYNISDYIYRCVKSITDQMDDRVQVIIVDDGSPDDSIERIADLCSSYENIEVHSKENGGLSSARNYGLEKAKGNYVYYVDGDDYLLEGVLPNIVDQLEEGKERCYVFKHLTIEEAEALSFGDNRAVARTVIETNAYLKEYRNPITNVWKVIVARQLLLEDNLLYRPGVYCEDVEWLTRLFIKVKRVAWLDRYVYVYDNSRAGSIMNVLSTKRILDLDSNIHRSKQMVDALSDQEMRSTLKKLLFIEWCMNLSFYAKLPKKEKSEVQIQDDFSSDEDNGLFRLFAIAKGILGIERLAGLLYSLKWARKRMKKFHVMNLVKKKIMDVS